MMSDFVGYIDDTGLEFQGGFTSEGAVGPKGDDGYTPVKGTDYWTDEDKAEIVADTSSVIATTLQPDIDAKVAKAGDTMTGSLTVPNLTVGSRAGTTGTNSVVTGSNNTASGYYSHAEGKGTTASGQGSHAEGGNAIASGPQSHAEGWNTMASYNSTHAEGTGTTASAQSAHAEGYSSTASGPVSHAEGYETTASGNYSHVEGRSTIAQGVYQHAQGRYNIASGNASSVSNSSIIHVVGNGSADNARSNAHTLTFDGTAWFAKDVYVGSTSGTDKDSGSKKLAKDDEVGHSISMTMDSSTYVLTVSLKNSAGDTLNTQTVDMPLESMVVSGSYDDATKKVILTLQGGSTVEFSVADLVSGLQTEITNSNKLSSDLVDDTNATHLFVSSSEKSTWNNKLDSLTAGTNIDITGSTISVDGDVIQEVTTDKKINEFDIGVYKLSSNVNIIYQQSPTTAMFSTDGIMVVYKNNNYTYYYIFSGDYPGGTASNVISQGYMHKDNGTGAYIGAGLVTGTEKNLWNSKQDNITLTPGSNYYIDQMTQGVYIIPYNELLSTKIYDNSSRQNLIFNSIVSDFFNSTFYGAVLTVTKQTNSGGMLPVSTGWQYSILVNNILTYGNVTGSGYTKNTLYISQIKTAAFTGTDGTSAGTIGLVPAPTTSDTDKFLKSDGTWATAGGGGSANISYGTTDLTPRSKPTSRRNILLCL